VLSGLVIGLSALGAASAAVFIPAWTLFLDDATLCAIEVSMIGSIFAIYKRFAPIESKYTTFQIIEKFFMSLATPAITSVAAQFGFYIVYKFTKIAPLVGGVIASVLTIVIGVLSVKVAEDAEHQRLFFDQEAYTVLLVSQLKSLIDKVMDKIANKKQKLTPVQAVEIVQAIVKEA